jgi:hypothetical protein
VIRYKIWNKNNCWCPPVNSFIWNKSNLAHAKVTTIGNRIRYLRLFFIVLYSHSGWMIDVTLLHHHASLTVAEKLNLVKHITVDVTRNNMISMISVNGSFFLVFYVWRIDIAEDDDLCILSSRPPWRNIYFHLIPRTIVNAQGVQSIFF